MSPLHSLQMTSSANRGSARSHCHRIRKIVPALLSALLLTFANATPDGVMVANGSQPTLCAEEDNVSVALIHPTITGCTIRAEHPAYAYTEDATQPNFDNCQIGVNDPVHDFDGFYTNRNLYDDQSTTAIHATRTNQFWRSNTADIVVNGVRAEGAHILTMYRKIEGENSWPQILVMYVADGNIRIKPHPRVGFGDSVFGASLLLGPVVEEGRPVVNIRQVEYFPAEDKFEIDYRDGGTGVLSLEKIDRSVLELRYSIHSDLQHAQPFGMLRSMYVAPTNCDTESARITRHDGSVETQTVIEASAYRATAVSFIRESTEQAHNRSAPDISLGEFQVHSAGLPVLERGIVSERDQNLQMTTREPMCGLWVNLTDTPAHRQRFAESRRPSVVNEFIYFDAIDTTDDSRRGFRLWLSDPSRVEQLTTDPLGNSFDNHIAVSPHHAMMLFRTNRPGEESIRLATRHQMGPGTGEAIQFGSPVTHWDRDPNLAQRMYTVDVASQLVFHREPPRAVVATSNWNSVTSGRIDRIETTALDPELLLSTDKGIYRLNKQTGAARLVVTGGFHAAFDQPDADQLVYTTVPTDKTNREVFVMSMHMAGTKSGVGKQRITENTSDHFYPSAFQLSPACLEMERRPSGRFYLIGPLWTLTAFGLESRSDLLGADWAPIGPNRQSGFPTDPYRWNLDLGLHLNGANPLDHFRLATDQVSPARRQ